MPESTKNFLSRCVALLQSLRSSVQAGMQEVLAHPRWQPLWQTIRAWRWQWLLVPPIAGALYTLALIPFTPAISDLRKAKLDQPAQVLSADGKELAVFKRSNREWVSLDQVSPAVLHALIATEDHRFYQHHGLDWWRIAGAAVHTLRGNTQGGSTLTQQLARNLYPEEIGRAASLHRKLKEAITAFKIELLYSKDEILETYLNTVPFLYNAFGIEMAARTYFDKSAAKLSVLEAATLVGMLKGTSYYNPVRNPERAVERRNTVLAQMVKHGQLSDKEFAQLRKRPLRLNFERQEVPVGMAPHFAQQVRKWLIDWADSQGYNIYTDGLVVHTTLDARLQQQALQAVRSHTRTLQALAQNNWSRRGGWQVDNPLVQTLVRESSAYAALREQGQSADAALQALLKDVAFMQQLRQDKTRVEAGFVALEPASAAIRAWVGSRDYATDAFDHVQQARRQPGSTFKPFVYGAALQAGAQAQDTRVDQEVAIELEGGGVWRPSDAGPPSGKAWSLRDALAHSKNTITAQLVQEVGPAKVARLARDLGVRDSALEEVPALALGASPVSLLEMSNAYSSLVRGGQYRSPWMVTRIEDRQGNILAEFAPHRAHSVMDASDSYALLDMLRAVVDKGTGRAIRQRFGIQGDVAGKTGTTQNNADGWFILMHPQLVSGAWVGFNDARITLRSDTWGQGARSALPIVGDFTARAFRDQRLDRQARFGEPETSSWWGSLTDGVREQLNAWWGTSADPAPAAPATPLQSAPRPAPAATPAPQPELLATQVPSGTELDGDADTAVEEAIPSLPPPRVPEQLPSDPLDAWIEQWSAPQPSEPEQGADVLRLPPAVMGQPVP